MIDQLRNLEARTILGTWTADEQFELAKSLAANCGYELIKDDVNIERINTIKAYIEVFKKPDCTHWLTTDSECMKIIIEGLEGLLK